MAQSSAGIKVYWASGVTKSGNTYSLPSSVSWSEIPDITSIPALKGDPNMLDATPLSETDMKRYVMGLADNGGALQYNAFATPELWAAIKTASTGAYAKWKSGIEASTPTYMAFAISFPAPLNRYYWYVGAPKLVLPGEAEVDGVLTTTFDTSMETAPVEGTGSIS